MIYSIKRFSKYSKDYEDRNREEFLEDIDYARKGKELKELDDTADRIRWRSDLKDYESNKGKGAAVLGGPGGIVGRVSGNVAANILDGADMSDEDISRHSKSIGTIVGIGAGIGTGYGIHKTLGANAEQTLKDAKADLAHFEKYKKDVPKYHKMSQAEKTQITQEINRSRQVIRNSQRRVAAGKYAMPVLGIVGALGAASAVEKSVSDRLAKRRAMDTEARHKKEKQERWDNFKHRTAEGLKKTGRYIKDIVTEDYRKNDGRK